MIEILEMVQARGKIWMNATNRKAADEWENLLERAAVDFKGPDAGEEGERLRPAEFP
jgi:hypothetical protein